MNKFEILEKAILKLDTQTPMITPGGWIIKYKNKAIKLESGKYLWSKEGFAKAALTNLFSQHIMKHKHGFTPSEVTKFLIDEEIVKIVQV